MAVGCLLAAPAWAKSPKPKTPPTVVDLVWPGPPERPRIRYLGSIAGAEDVTGRVKPSFIERLSGRSPLRDQLRLMKPYGVVVDKSNRIFVADTVQRAVLVFHRETGAAVRWRGNAQFPLFLPVGLALDPQGRLFVSDSFARHIVVFDPSGKPVAALGKGNLVRPGGLAIDAQRGWLYVADVVRNQIYVFNTTTLKLEKAIGSVILKGAPSEGRFSGPTNVALDSKGNLYVTDTWNCRVQVFDPEGKFLRVFGTQGIQPGMFMRPKGIAIDNEDHVYVVDAEFNNFQIFTPEGRPLLFVGSQGEEPGQFLLPTGMFIDHQNRIYVTEHRLGGGRLQIFQFLSEANDPPQPASGDRGPKEKAYARAR